MKTRGPIKLSELTAPALGWAPYTSAIGIIILEGTLVAVRITNVSAL